MTDSLVNLFKAIANSPNEQTLEQEVIPQIGAYFVAKRCRLFLISHRLLRRPKGYTQCDKCKPLRI